MDSGHLPPFLSALATRLEKTRFSLSKQTFILHSGRVRAGYEVGSILFQKSTKPCALLHVIGERPGNGHHTFSIYLTVSREWGTKKIDHDITRVVSGVADTAFDPVKAGLDCVEIMEEKFNL